MMMMMKYIKQINSGIKDYVMSSIKKSYNLDLLKASILNANGHDLITHKYDISEEDVKQIIPTTYFEKTEDFLSIDNSWLIKSNNVLYYQDKAKYYTKKYYQSFIKLMSIWKVYIYIEDKAI